MNTTVFIVVAVIVIIAAISAYIIDFRHSNEDEEPKRRKKAARKAALIMAVGLVAGFLLSVAAGFIINGEDPTPSPAATVDPATQTQNDKPTPPPSPTPEIPVGARYSIYDDQAIQLRIDAVNEFLSSEGKQVKSADLKAFIWFVNGDDSLINEEIFDRVTTAMVNIDIPACHLLFGFTDVTDKFTSIDALADIMMDEQDYLFVKYWVSRRNSVYEMIYRDGKTERTQEAAEQWGVEIYNVFSGFDTITAEDGTLLSGHTITNEVYYLTNGIINSLVPQMILDLHNDYEDLLPLGKMIGDDPTYVRVGELMEKYQMFEDEARDIKEQWFS